MADIQASKQKTATTEQMEKDTKVAQQDIDDQLKQWEEEMAEERCAIEEDLLKQFEAGFKKAKTLYHHLFTNLKLDFDQVSPQHELKDGVLVLPSDDEDEIADEDMVVDAAGDHPATP